MQHCSLINLESDQVLYELDEPLSECYFPQTALISLVSILPNHPPLALGMIGNEGMLGATLILDVETMPMRVLVQGAGTALQISAAYLRDELKSYPDLQQVLKHYLYVLIAQSWRSAVCAHFHEIEPRLARWLLMTHDHVQGDNFYLTHEYLSGVLGVRRSGITIAAGALQHKGLIRYRRGEIRILDRQGLEVASCECYSALSQYYSCLFTGRDLQN